MRTQLLCALALLGGGTAAHAQQGSGYAFHGNSQQSAASYPAGAASYAAYGYPQNGMAAAYAPYNQGYQYYPAAAAYPYYNAYGAGGYPNYYANGYPQSGNNLPMVPAGMGGDAGAAAACQVPLDQYGAEDHHQPEPTCAAPAQPCYRPAKDKFWVSAEYMMGWMKEMRLNGPLVTVGAAQDARAGAIGQQGTSVLYGTAPVDFGLFSGLRGEIGFFLDDANRFSLDWSGMIYLPNHQNFIRGSDNTGNPVLARPVIFAVNNPALAGEGTFTSSLPNLFAGTISVDTRSEFASTEFNARYHLCTNSCFHADTLFGFRYARLSESLTIQDKLQPLGANNIVTFNGNPVNPPDLLVDEDRFRTTNNFYGLQIGGHVRWEGEWFFVDGFGKVGLGATDQKVDINGSTSQISPTGVATVQGGILALPSNIGHHNRAVLGYVSEIGFNGGVNVTKHWRLTAGYSFLFWNDVVRAGREYDRTINPNTVPGFANFGNVTGPARPSFSFNEEAFWIHNLLFGIELHY